MSDRQGVEIDYCNECRGVWLDRGELDKIIEKSIANETGRNNTDNNDYQSNNRSDNRSHDDYDRNHNDHDSHNNEYSQNNGYKKKKGNFLGDLLDF